MCVCVCVCVRRREGGGGGVALWPLHTLKGFSVCDSGAELTLASFLSFGQQRIRERERVRSIVAFPLVLVQRAA